jgi:hypothetical protein
VSIPIPIAPRGSSTPFCPAKPFALSYFTERYAAGFGYGTSSLLVACYAIMFFPLALVGVKASLARASASLEEVARSLGRHGLTVLFRVTARLAWPGLIATFCLVFLSAVVLLDEPFASLDARLRAGVRADVQEIFRRAGTTAVLVTHDQDEALSTAVRGRDPARREDRAVRAARGPLPSADQNS